MGEFRMPSLGADMERGVLIEWLIKVGDPVRRGDVVAVVETPKSAVEVECFETGTVEQILVEEGQSVPVGAPLAVLAAATPAGVARSSPTTGPDPRPEGKHARDRQGKPAHQPPRPTAAGAVTAAGAETGAGERRVWISPLARRLAADAGIDITQLSGTGLGGAIRADDVRGAAGSTRLPVEALAEAEVEAGARAGAGDVSHAPTRSADERADDMRRSIAALMTVANREIPQYHVTLTVDLHQAMVWMRERNRELDMSERLVPAALVLKAVARAALSMPELNGHWVEGRFRPSGEVDLGLVISLRGGGLLVPTVTRADTLSVGEMMARVKVLTSRARSGRLRGSDLGTPTITVSNLGDQGVDSVLGVIYPPQVALVGVGAVVERPWAVDGLLGVRPLVTVSLTGDHRATDGATGSRFLKTLDRLLQTPEEL